MVLSTLRFMNLTKSWSRSMSFCVMRNWSSPLKRFSIRTWVVPAQPSASIFGWCIWSFAGVWATKKWSGRSERDCRGGIFVGFRWWIRSPMQRLWSSLINALARIGSPGLTSNWSNRCWRADRLSRGGFGSIPPRLRPTSATPTMSESFTRR